MLESPERTAVVRGAGGQGAAAAAPGAPVSGWEVGERGQTDGSQAEPLRSEQQGENGGPSAHFSSEMFPYKISRWEVTGYRGMWSKRGFYFILPTKKVKAGLWGEGEEARRKTRPF